MQAGTELIVAERMLPDGPDFNLNTQEGHVRIKTNYKSISSVTAIHWQYKPLTEGPLYKMFGPNIIDSIKMNFQFNSHSFCQWFSAIAFYADHGNAFAMWTFMAFKQFRNKDNCRLIINFVRHSEIPEIVKIRHDMRLRKNCIAFFNAGKAKKLTETTIMKYFPKRLFGVHYIFYEEYFFDTLSMAVENELGDWPPSL